MTAATSRALSVSGGASTEPVVAQPTVLGEVPSLRTSDSDTYQTADGAYLARVYPVRSTIARLTAAMSRSMIHWSRLRADL